MNKKAQNHSGWIRKSMNRHLLGGVVAISLLGFGVGGWAASTDISGAVVSPGMIVSASYLKKVQHPTGGVVSVIHVRDNSHVKASDLLISLDDTVMRSNLAIVTKGLDQLRGRKARLLAERDHLEKVVFPSELTNRLDDPRVLELVKSEKRLFDLRNAVRDGQRRQLKERINQTNEEITGLIAQRDAKLGESELVNQEAESTRRLWALNVVEKNRMIALDREVTRIKGESAQLTAAIASARGKIAEIELQIIQVDNDLESEVADEMRDIDAQVGELEERRIAADDQLKRIEIRAPQDGYVHELSVHTVGGVITPADVLMQIVPDDNLLAVEARVRPQDIDQISINQRATLRFSAFSQRTTPEVTGTLSSISPDVSTDRRTGASYYNVRIMISAQEVSRLGDVAIIPGMPVEAFIKTGDRSVGSYLVKPFHDQLMRAFRET